MAKKKKRRGRKKGGKNTTPESLLNQLVPVGKRNEHSGVEFVEVEEVEAEAVDADFTGEKFYLDPVEFCEAVYHADEEVLNRLGIFKPPTMTQRMQAAKIAAPFRNKKKPQESVTRHEHSWADEMKLADERVATRINLDAERERETIN